MSQYNSVEDDRSLYPLTPGHKGTDTSKQAAAAVESKADLLRKRSLLAVRRAAQHDPGVLAAGRSPDPKKTPATNSAGQAVGITVQEACALLGEPTYNVNPRFSELRAAGLIRDSGVRRVNQHSNRNAVAWVPGDDPAKPAPAGTNAPPAKPALLAAYLRGLAAAYYMVRAYEQPNSAAALALRGRLAELEPGNPEWQPE